MDYLNYNDIYYFSGDQTTKECFVSSSSDISSDYLASCDCPLECKSEEYTLDISSSGFGNFKEIVIFYDQLKETVITEEPKTRLNDLIANIGGILGLFSGFSFLSMIELVEILVQVILIYLDDRKSRSKVKPRQDQQAARPNLIMVQPANKDEQQPETSRGSDKTQVSFHAHYFKPKNKNMKHLDFKCF